MGTELTQTEIVGTPAQVRAHVNLIQEVMQAVMKEGTHYGKIPGVKKNSLFKPGAEVLGVTFHVAVSYEIEDLGGKDFSRYRVRAIGRHQQTDIKVGEGMGACSSLEEKYKWRKATTREYNAAPDDLRRLKYGYNANERKEYETYQVRTEAADLDNTVLKMACKRAQVAMIINVTGASDIFTQDIEDLPEELQREIVDTDTGEVKQAVKMPQAAEKKTAAAKSQEVEPTEQPAEAGEVAFITKKLEALPGTGGADLLVRLGLTIPGLTKNGFAAIKEALKNGS